MIGAPSSSQLRGSVLAKMIISFWVTTTSRCRAFRSDYRGPDACRNGGVSAVAADIAAIDKNGCRQKNEIGDQRRKQPHAANQAARSYRGQLREDRYAETEG